MKTSCQLVLLAALMVSTAATPRVRPVEWAQPVISTALGNCYRVSDELFRAEQPATKEIPDLKALGIRTLVNLRSEHPDSGAFARAGLRLVAHEMRAGAVSEADLVTVLREIRAAPKPVLVHCWRGSDRTGFVVAGYRMVLQGWTREAAIDELRNGGFGFHESQYKNIIELIAKLDVAALRKAVIE